MGCGEVREDGAACDPVAPGEAIRRHGGPFKLTSSSPPRPPPPPPPPPPSPKRRRRARKTTRRRRRRGTSEKEEDESVAATEEDEDEDEEDAGSEVESVAETMSVAGTEATDRWTTRRLSGGSRGVSRRVHRWSRPGLRPWMPSPPEFAAGIRPRRRPPRTFRTRDGSRERPPRRRTRACGAQRGRF